MIDPEIEKKVLQQLMDEMYSMDADGAMKKKKKGKYADMPMISIEIETKGKGPGPMAGPMAAMEEAQEGDVVPAGPVPDFGMPDDEEDDEDDLMAEEAGMLGVKGAENVDPRLLRKMIEKLKSS